MMCLLDSRISASSALYPSKPQTHHPSVGWVRPETVLIAAAAAFTSTHAGQPDLSTEVLPLQRRPLRNPPRIPGQSRNSLSSRKYASIPFPLHPALPQPFS